MTPGRSRHFRAAVALVAGCAWSAHMIAADPPACPDDLNALFRVAEQESLGVWVTDRAAVIGGVVADEKFHNRLLNAFMPLPGWYPVDGTKRIVCGTLEYWNAYHGPGKELDLHSYIVPSSSFASILDDLPPYGTIDRGHDHIWGEVTPPAWFAPFWRVPRSGRNGDQWVPLGPQDNACGQDEPACNITLWTKETENTACMYGPWIMERIYKYRVEIHPTQMMWGRTGDALRLLVLSDGSERFDEKRSYRRSTAAEKWFSWSKPLSPTVWIAEEAQPQQSRTVSVTRGSLTLTPAPPGPVATTTVDLGMGASVSVTHSRDLQIARGPSCRSTSGAIRGFVAVSASGDRELQALDVRGDILSHPAQKPPALQQEAPTRTESEKEDASAVAPSIDLRAVEWFPPQPLNASLSLPETRRAWGFGPTDDVTWTAARRQRLKLQITTGKGSPPPSGSRYWLDWQVEACDVEASASTCRPVPLGTGNNDLYVEIARGSRVAITVPDAVKETKNAAPHELILFVRYPVARQLGDTLTASSLRVRLSATLTDAAGRKAAFTHVLRNIAPDFSSAIQPYNVDQQGGAIPEALIQFSVGWLRQQGVPVTRAELERDWSLSTAANGEVLGPLERQIRRRTARVLRLSFLTFLEDETLDAEEMTDVFEMLNNYAQAVWSAP